MRIRSGDSLGLFEDALVSLRRDAEVLESIFEAVSIGLRSGSLRIQAQALHGMARQVSGLTAEFLAESSKRKRKESQFCTIAAPWEYV
ncbi:MAG: hypothetical protein LAO55_23275 [Acidobacteriia bacterium]|nr:hypothetical protein [Terriglobia bacterium]